MKKKSPDLSLPPGKLPPNASKAEVAEMQKRGHDTIKRVVEAMPRTWKETVVLLDVPFIPNQELFRAALALPAVTPAVPMRKIFAQDWEESERGWGVRPDGVSLHATLAKMNEYKRKFYSDQPPRGADGSAPDEYARESGEPYEITVDETLYKQVVAAGTAMHARGVKRGKDANGFTTWAVHLYPPAPVQPASREDLFALVVKMAKNADLPLDIAAEVKSVLSREPEETILNGKIYDKSGKLIGEVKK